MGIFSFYLFYMLGFILLTSWTLEDYLYFPTFYILNHKFTILYKTIINELQTFTKVHQTNTKHTPWEVNLRTFRKNTAPHMCQRNHLRVLGLDVENGDSVP